MKKQSLYIACGLAALGLTLAALPGSSQVPQDAEDSTTSLQKKLENLQTRLRDTFGVRQAEAIQLAQEQAMVAAQRGLARQEEGLNRIREIPGVEDEDVTVLVGGEGQSWLGVETHEVTADKMKDLKLSAERGVVVGRVTPDSPAAKAGLKENDVITEINGQRVEGATQFRRMIREIPAGRNVLLTVWRAGRLQSIAATLGRAEEGQRVWNSSAMPGRFAFRMPELPDIPEIPQMEWGEGFMVPGGRPRLGIDAEDLSGQLAAYFGAPDGEGVLVREVNSGSAAEKAGVKAGDVITTFNGERIRSIGDLREKLAGKKDDKPAKLGVLRNKSELSLDIELPAPATKSARMGHRTNI